MHTVTDTIISDSDQCLPLMWFFYCLFSSIIEGGAYFESFKLCDNLIVFLLP